MKRSHGLQYTIGDIDSGIARIIDMMGHDDPSIRATARLNRDLVNVIQAFLDTEHPTTSPPMSTMLATMHGVTTVCGSLLLSIDSKANRKKCHALMRKQLLAIFDAMGAAIEQEEDA